MADIGVQRKRKGGPWLYLVPLLLLLLLLFLLLRGCDRDDADRAAPAATDTVGMAAPAATPPAARGVEIVAGGNTEAG